MFSDESEFEELSQIKKDIQDTMKEIRDHRREVRLALRMPSLDYTTVLGTEVIAQSLLGIFMLKYRTLLHCLIYLFFF